MLRLALLPQQVAALPRLCGRLCGRLSPSLVCAILPSLHTSLDAGYRCMQQVHCCGDDGNEFELLCLHRFQIAGAGILAQLLIDGAQLSSARVGAELV